MSHDEISQIKNFIRDEFEALKSVHHSEFTGQIIQLQKEIKENTELTQKVLNHPIFKAWNDGKTIVKFMKWGGIALIGLSTLVVAIKNGGSVIKEYFKFFIRI